MKIFPYHNIRILSLFFFSWNTYGHSSDIKPNSAKDLSSLFNNFGTSLFIHSELGNQLIKEIQKHAPAFPFLGWHIRQALERAGQNLGLPNPEDDICDRDFSVLCPKQWFPKGDGAHCIPSEMYRGPCTEETKFSDLTPLGKLRLSLDCNVSWPCKSAKCVQDFTMPCPENFHLQEDGSCVASSLYYGRCIRKVSFQNISIPYRMIWGEQCNVYWPCYKSCTAYEASACPQKWTLSQSKKNCIAPLNYLGPCSPIQPTSVPKAIMIDQCQCKYECQDTRKIIQSVPQCEHDYKKPCPLGWTLLDESKSLCIAPEWYKGDCAFKFSFLNYTATMKRAISRACRVMWPCLHSTTVSKASNSNDLKLSENINIMSAQNTIFNGPTIMKDTRNSNEESLTLSENEQFKSNTTKTYSSLRNIRHRTFLKEFLFYAKNRIPMTIHDAIKTAEKTLETMPDDVLLTFSVEHNQSKPEHHDNLSPRFTSISGFNEHKAGNHIGNVMTTPILKSMPTNLKDSVISSSKQRRPLGMKTFLKRMNDKDLLHQIMTNLDARLDPYANHISDQGPTDLRSKCVRDYAVACPIGWSPIIHLNSSFHRTPTMCIADETFQNTLACGTLQPFGSMNQQEKQIAERTCHVEWPCKHCIHDYIRSFCPQGWLHIGDGNCRKSDWIIKREKFLGSVETKPLWCSNIVNFKYMVPELRRLWGKICGYEWPCFQNCERDFSSPCPKNWIEVPQDNQETLPYSICQQSEFHSNTSADSGEFPCGRVLKVPLSLQGKYTLEATCSVQWPCRELCKVDFYQRCPYGFFLIPTSKTCIPLTDDSPTSYLGDVQENSIYDGSCLEIPGFSFFFSHEKKKLYSSICHVSWPCTTSCEQDFTSPCPQKWSKKLSENRITCIPNSSYRGPCSDIQYNIKSSSKLVKWGFAWKCQVTWPCQTPIHSRLLKRIISKFYKVSP